MPVIIEKKDTHFFFPAFFKKNMAQGRYISMNVITECNEIITPDVGGK